MNFALFKTLSLVSRASWGPVASSEIWQLRSKQETDLLAGVWHYSVPALGLVSKLREKILNLGIFSITELSELPL